MNMLKNFFKKWPLLNCLCLIGISVFPYFFWYAYEMRDIEWIDQWRWRSALIALVLVLIVGIRSVKRKTLSAGDMALMNLILKFIYMPVFIWVFNLGLFAVLNILTIGFIAILWVWDAVFIAISGIFGTLCMIKAAKEKEIRKSTAVIWSIFQFVFCLDVIVALMLCTKIILNEEAVEKGKANESVFLGQ